MGTDAGGLGHERPYTHSWDGFDRIVCRKPRSLTLVDTQHTQHYDSLVDR